MMLFSVWLTFAIGSLVLYTAGYYTKNDLLRILAVILLFTCGGVLDPIGGGIQVTTGAVANYSLITNTTANASQVDVYTNFSSHLFGFYMMATALLTLVYILFERRYPNNTRD